MTAYKKKLIEVALPLEAINKASAREKSIRHGHPSTLHLWWARRPFRIIEDLVLWENTTNEEVLQRARDEIRQSWRATCAENADHPRAKELFDRHKLPAFHDPFAGGSSLPLEAQGLADEVQTPKTRCYGPTALMTCDEYACGGRRGTNEK